MSLPPVRSASIRVYRLLLRACSRRFQRRFAEDMCSVFQQDLMTRSGRPLVRFWTRTVFQVLRLAAGERWSRRRGARRPGRLSSGIGGPRLDRGVSSMINNWTSDVQTAWRALNQNRTGSLIAFVALSLGLGASVCAFGILHGTLLRGLPFESAEDLVHFERRSQDNPSMAVTPHDYLDWRDQQGTFEDLAAFVEAPIFLAQEGGPPERLWGVAIEPQAFELLRVQPSLGRLFTLEEAQREESVILLSNGFWKNRFGGDPAVVGSPVGIGVSTAVVVGIMPPDFGFPIAEHFWVPLRIDLQATARGSGRLDVFGRLRPGATFEQAEVEFEAISQRLEQAYPASNKGIEAALKTFEQEYVGEEFARLIYKILIAALLVLAVACCNVANLFLGRTASRKREFAMRAALGAGKLRITRLVLVETLVVTVPAAIAGLFAAWLGLGWFERAAVQPGVIPLPHGSDALFWWNLSLNWVAGAFLIGVALLSTLLAGLVPAWLATRSDANGVLKDEVRGTSGRMLRRLNRGLVVAEVGLTTALLIVAALSAKSVLLASRVDENFSAQQIMTARVSLFGAFDDAQRRYDDHSARQSFWLRYLERLRSAPGVARVTATTYLPAESLLQVAICRDRAKVQSGPCPEGYVATISADYFEVFQVPILQGRGFDNGDGPAGQAVALVNQSFVDRHYAGQSPLGRAIRLGPSDSQDPWTTIVGVVPDLWRSSQPDRPQDSVYVPLRQSGTLNPRLRLGRWELRSLTLAARGFGDENLLAQSLRESLHATDPDLAITLLSFEDSLRRRFGRFEIPGRFYQAFGMMALFLACFGMYGVLSFSVRSRRSEIGVRMTLGATAGHIQRSVLGEGSLQILVGLVLGLLLAGPFTQGMDRFLYRVEPADPTVWVGAVVLVALTGFLACWLPSRRAARVDPLEAIRAE